MKPVPAPGQTRLKACVRGAVQGVGFRPFIYRLATELGLAGWVNNSAQGVFLEVEGARPALEQFLLRLETDKPPRSFIQSLETAWLDPVGYGAFEIRPSEAGGEKTALVLPDIATCPDCRREIFDPANRRYLYPFTNCTNCGPRFTIIEALPYDRANTSMKRFTMCPACQAEYENPLDRRFHAQPNACPVCGPHLELWDRTGRVLGSHHEALRSAAEAICRGQIVAVKGLGGFHLMVAAHDDPAVRRLRDLKHREEKPFALMFPSLEQVKAACEVNEFEARLLRSPEAPIVLLRRRPQLAIGNWQLAMSPSLAPGNPNLGVMLPYTPLHHLLLAELGFPVVATSGNLSDEPICTDEHEACERLGAMADLFLVHNRPIVRHVDDSIARVMLGRELVLRRARGYAPLPVILKQPAPPTLAVGAHLKNSVALAVGRQVFISQHIGDLETDQAFEAFRRVIVDFERLYEERPAVVAADAHPDYLSTKFAKDTVTQASSLRYVSVQHHYAHVLSCMAENELEAPVLGICWDGTGYGLDGTIWGGEFLYVTGNTFHRAGYLRPFRLPGGDKAVKEPRRVALGVLYEMCGDAAFTKRELAPLRASSQTELATLQTMLQRGVNAPLTSSAGRLFDAVASLIDLRQHLRYEGQAAMELEFALEGFATDETYPFRLESTVERVTQSAIRNSQSAIDRPQSAIIVDWSAMIQSLLADAQRALPAGLIAAKFHNSLVEMMVAMAQRVGEPKVALSGGCFQNRYLTERAVRRLRQAGFRPYWHQRVPPNDGGIALGQIVAGSLPIA